jgi:hypothetical protein
VIAKWKAFWGRNGTKLLGFVGSLYSAFIAGIGLLAADPHTPVLMSPRAFAYLAIGNVMLHAIVAKRGFTNTRKLSA